jgi:hypothetical protein
MAKVRVRGKGLHGPYEVEVEVADQHAAAVMASAVEKAHGSSLSIKPAPGRTEGRRIVERSLSEYGADRPPLSAEEAAALRPKVPTIDQVEQFILRQPERLHSHPAVSQEFLGRSVSISKDRSAAEQRLFYLLHRRIEDARRRIEKRDRTGKFTKDAAAFGTRRVYRWQREGAATA